MAYVCSGNTCAFVTDCNQAHLLYHIKNNIPTKITHHQIDLLPKRNDFLDPDIANAVKNVINLRNPTLFMPTSIHEKNVYVDGSPKYYLYIFGISLCGSKTCVVIDDIPVYIDVMVPVGKQDIFDALLSGQFENINYTHMETVYMFKLKGFQQKKQPYKRVYFESLLERKRALDKIAEINKSLAENGKPGLETASDDTGRDDFYFPKVARDYGFATADWNRLENYSVLSPTITTNCSYVLKVSVNDYKKLDREKRNTLIGSGTTIGKVLERDSTLMCSWDIETYRTIQNGLVPTVKDTDYTIFMMCSAYFWHHSTQSMLEVCCVDKPANARAGIKLMIVCDNEINVLTTHMNVVGRMAPDILGAYNGGNFDWPLYREKLLRNDLLVQLKQNLSSLPVNNRGKYADTTKNIHDWSFRREKIKIDAENDHILDCVARFPGLLDIDIMPIFLKSNSREEVGKGGSLNFFLKKNGLEQKEDMSYIRMFKIYERACKLSNIKSCHCNTDTCAICKEIEKNIDCKPNTNVNIDLEYSNELHNDLVQNGKPVCCYCGKRQRNILDMADVGYYCVIDCIRPQQLMVKQSVLTEKREISILANVSLYDAFYRADGMKVTNLVAKYCNKRGLAYSSAKSTLSVHDKDHYPGGWVFIPNRGLHSDGMIEITVSDDAGTKTTKKIRCRPITGLDFNSLYPSLIMTFNISPDRTVYDKNDADRLIAEGYSLYHIKPFEFERGEKKKLATNKHYVKEGWMVRHNGVFDSATVNIVDKYVKTITYKYADGPNNVTLVHTAITTPTNEQQIALDLIAAGKIKATRKVSYEPQKGRRALVNESMGIFPYILKKLFDKRVPIKAELVELKEIMEHMKMQKLTEYTYTKGGTSRLLTEADLSFMLNKTNSKQIALKLLSNTFYGMAGNFRASIYELLVAAGTTCAGQENIKRVASFVENKGFTVHYGDTDSLYMSCPDTAYAKCDAEYESTMQCIHQQFAGINNINEPVSEAEINYKNARIAARETWWRVQVEITMKTMNQLKEEVSDYLLEDNGTNFLNMAYEEVLYPVALCGKKKYFGAEHMKVINFHPDDVFKRGIDIVKQGQTKIAKQLGIEFMMEAVSPRNEREMIDIAEDKIRKFYNTVMDPHLFALNAKYKPAKKNIPVHKFVDRMVEMQKTYANDPIMFALYEPPAPGDKFEYIVVKKEITYTLEGKRNELKKGDHMEFLRVFKASQKTSNPMQIDTDYYMEGSILGLFARFIAYHHKFQPVAGTYDCSDKQQYKEMDAFCIKRAVEYLTSICHNITGYDRKSITQQGRDYRKLYNGMGKQLQKDITAKYGSASGVIQYISGCAEDTLATIKTIVAANSTISGYGRDFIATACMSIYRLKQIYLGDRSSFAKSKLALCDRDEKIVSNKLLRILPHCIDSLQRHGKNFENLIVLARNTGCSSAEMVTSGIDGLDIFDDSTIKSVKSIHDLMFDLTAIYKTRNSVCDLINAIELEISSKITEPTAPVMNVYGMAKMEAKNAAVIPDYEWA